jgi:hypothetical protein
VTASKFKPVMFSLLNFALSSIANITYFHPYIKSQLVPYKKHIMHSFNMFSGICSNHGDVKGYIRKVLNKQALFHTVILWCLLVYSKS